MVGRFSTEIKYFEKGGTQLNSAPRRSIKNSRRLSYIYQKNRTAPSCSTANQEALLGGPNPWDPPAQEGEVCKEASEAKFVDRNDRKGVGNFLGWVDSL